MVHLTSILLLRAQTTPRVAFAFFVPAWRLEETAVQCHLGQAAKFRNAKQHSARLTAMFPPESIVVRAITTRMTSRNSVGSSARRGCAPRARPHRPMTNDLRQTSADNAWAGDRGNHKPWRTTGRAASMPSSRPLLVSAGVRRRRPRAPAPCVGGRQRQTAGRTRWFRRPRRRSR
jgi:hypothetical protein